MNVKSFYENGATAEAISRYLHIDGLPEQFSKSVANLEADECLIPVLGTQGSGKSSFLDAVLFNDVILPVDADETTCIPTEVRYGDKRELEASVVFNSGVKETVECTEAGLGEYVHQAKNPANRKDVAYIEIRLANELLKDGIALVDLPGVGSVTEENQKTTLDYISNCPAAIFMLRTVPPITNSESVFIQGALPLVHGPVFWVQNQWTDESQDEVAEGLEHNYTVLKGIASRIFLPESAIKRPTIVCVKQALDGRIKDDGQALEKSGLNAFMDSVVSFAKTWRKDVISNAREQALALLAETQVAAEKKLERLMGDTSEERSRMEKKLKENEQLCREARDYLDHQYSEIEQLIFSECQKSTEDLRNNVRSTINGGVVGGQQLQRAFDDHKKRAGETMFQNIQPALLDLNAGIAQILSGIEDCRFSLDDARISISDNNFSEKSQSHENYGVIGGSLGGLTAAIGISLAAATGPVGWVVGGITMLLGSLIGGGIGNKMREIEREKQKKTARAELFSAAEDFGSAAKKRFIEALEKYRNDTDSSIRSWLKVQKKSVEEYFAKAAAELSASAESKERQAAEVGADIKRFKAWRSELAEDGYR